MSPKLISRNADLRRLRDEGYDLATPDGYAVVRQVPYVGPDRTIRYGSLISQLDLAGEATDRPHTHVIFFDGEVPCDQNGRPITGLGANPTNKRIGEGLTARLQFSSKPEGGYEDYHHKLTSYVRILLGPAQAIDPAVNATPFPAVADEDDDSPFVYVDTASSRAGIVELSRRFSGLKVAIVGLGGTGSYVLDLVAKTRVAQIHLFDGDGFLTHNAFRSPGAASLAALEEEPLKVEYHRATYANMHKGIVAHPEYLNDENLALLDGMDHVFLCLDIGPAKRPIVAYLEAAGTPFFDTGIGVDLIDDKLTGLVRTTTSTPTQRAHVHDQGRISFAQGDEDGVYDQNIQLAELNALNAAFAVIRWKKLCGVYHDLMGEHHALYTINANTNTNEDRA